MRSRGARDVLDRTCGVDRVAAPDGQEPENDRRVLIDRDTERQSRRRQVIGGESGGTMAFRLSGRAMGSIRRFAAAGCAILGAVLVEPAAGQGDPPGRLESKGGRLRRVSPDAPISALATIPDLEATETAKLTATDADELDHLGSSVAIDGDILIAGAFRDSHDSAINAGSAYVFVRDSGNAGAWEQVAKLIGTDTASCDYFGFSVAISGDTAVVGARHNDPGGLSEAGAAYIFTRDQGGADAWGQVAKLTAGDAEPGDSFGISVAISGDTVVVGSALDDHDGKYHAGSAYVFMRDTGGTDAWGQVAKLTAADAEERDEFGTSVAVEGDTVVVGAILDNHPGLLGTGSAYIFMRDLGGANAWGELIKITASDDEVGDEFGTSLAISGDSVVVGVGGYAGEEAYVFDRNSGGSGVWGQVAKITASDAGANDDFGYAVAIDRDTVVVGAALAGFSGQPTAGSAYVFLRDQGGPDAWGEAAKLTASDGENEDRFGVSVTIDGTSVAIGASGDDHSGVQNPGSLYLFELAHPSVPFFSDGFESGNTSAWSATIP